jgi:hypothetical protein
MSMQGHMQREKKACRLAAPFCLTEMKIMYERSHVLGLSACIPDEGVAYSMPNEEEDILRSCHQISLHPHHQHATNRRGSLILQVLRKEALGRKGRIPWLE